MKLIRTKKKKRGVQTQEKMKTDRETTRGRQTQGYTFPFYFNMTKIYKEAGYNTINHLKKRINLNIF